ncbi:MAG TPA: lactate racemase domain-containing protein [Bryobacteraceae bacterium]
MSLFLADGSESREFSLEELKQGLFRALDALGSRGKVIAVPPDITRYHSRAGELTRFAFEYYGDRLTHVLPATGTHTPMNDRELDLMYGGIPRERFAVHDFRAGLSNLGEVPADFVREQSEGRLDFSWPVEINRLLAEGGFDLILSIGQVVPHEVAGMANYNKNVLIGTGGAEGISRSHYLGAVYGMERIMGRANNPVRRVLNYASERITHRLPIVYVLTVVAAGSTRGLFIGDDLECFERASRLSLKVNFAMLERPIRKAVVYLDPTEFKSTWIGNKAIYRLRMAMADCGELIVLAPGVKQFGEDAAIDAVIRKHGYAGTPAVLNAVEANPDLASNLSAAAHLIHGSTEGRFTVTYCAGGLSREEVERANFRYAPLAPMLERYDIARLRDGVNIVGGEEIFFVSNPALGLWAHGGRFSASQEESDLWQLTPKR